jgi:uncharacterized protein YqjF (DUF2071 family)
VAHVNTKLDAFPWIVGLTYEHLLLVHWPVPVDLLQAKLPRGMKVAVCEGKGWLGHDIYLGTKTRVRGLPPFPDLVENPVVTLRTVVEVDGARGLYLFGMDAISLFAAWVGRTCFGLRSYGAELQINEDGAGLTVACKRLEAPAAQLQGRYRPVGPTAAPAPGSRDEFLLGGGFLFTGGGEKAITATPFEHGEWALSPAEVTFASNTMAQAVGLPPPGADVAAVYQRAQQGYVAMPKPAT